MCRIARVVLPGFPHHITQRGVRRLDIFRDKDDRSFYKGFFAESSRKFGLTVCAYCLMTNHVHFVAIPERTDSIWRTFHRCHGLYAARFNVKYGLVGHLFQGRPYSSVLDESHFWSAIRYVERNPLRAGMVERAEDYHWSSAAAHCRKSEDGLLDPTWAAVLEISDWSKWLQGEETQESLDQIRSSTVKGRPCGDDDFLRQVETETGRQLRPQKRGPKPVADAEGTPTLWNFGDAHQN